jgi:hypothetical protein
MIYLVEIKENPTVDGGVESKIRLRSTRSKISMRLLIK